MEVLNSKCHHIRIPDPNVYDGNTPEQWIKYLQKKYQLNIKTIPQWKELVKRMHVVATDCKSRIQDAHLRKQYIAQKLFLEYTRPTPFELTDRLARTAKKWEQIEKDLQRKRIRSVLPDLGPLSSQLSSRSSETIHQNTLVPEAEAETELSVGSAPSESSESKEISHLPPIVFTNEHKLIFPSQHSIPMIGQHETKKFESNASEWMLLKQSTLVESRPPMIRIIYNDLHRQFLSFTVTNRSKKIMFIQFKKVTNEDPFRHSKLEPVCQQKLYPGLPQSFVFSFRLKVFVDEFTSQLYFKVGYDVYNIEPDEAFCIPVVSDFQKGRSVSVPESVVIPALYPWHFRLHKTKASFEVSVDDGRFYHLHIVKRKVDHVSEGSDKDLSSTKVVSPSSRDVEEKKSVTDTTLRTSLGAKSSKSKLSKTGLGSVEAVFSYTKYYMSLISADIVERALDTFYFKRTYFPFFITDPRKRRISVRLSKIERTGWHYEYYDFQFYDPRTKDVVINKTMKVFVEILAHPISIQPELILIMTESAPYHGYCQDKFVISNSHKLYPVRVKICLTRQMKKLFRIIPMKSVIPITSSVTFEIKFCTMDRIRQAEDYVHFTIKILVFGHERIYKGVPPMYYEIVAPCEIYFNHLLDRPTMLVDPTELAF